MEVFEKLIKPIDETKYLSTENSYRYRPIMRCFYQHYEKLDYWLYKEDVYNELKDNTIFTSYTLDDCERDLETLVSWLSLSKMQDTKNAATIEEFKSKKFRYQLTEYATVIERMTISLEEMEVKTASLEPKLFDRLRIDIEKLIDVEKLSLDDIRELWDTLGTDFTKLNESYQDFLKKFNEPKTDELLQSTLFLNFKRDIINYLKDFVKGYQKNINQIRSYINNIDEHKINYFLDKLEENFRKVPLKSKNFDFQRFRSVNTGKLNNIFNWFVSNNLRDCEGDKLISFTNGIIVKLTQYANSLVDLHGNMNNRREEYKYLCRLFDKLPNIMEAHKYASVVIGIEKVRHFVGYSKINTDSIVNSYDVSPIEISLNSRTYNKKTKSLVEPIIDKTSLKRKILEDYKKEQEESKLVLKNLIKDKKICLKDNVILSKVERRYIEKLLANRNNKETEFGLTYEIKKLDGVCRIDSPDGLFILDSIEINFEGEVNEE